MHMHDGHSVGYVRVYVGTYCMDVYVCMYVRSLHPWNVLSHTGLLGSGAGCDA